MMHGPNSERQQQCRIPVCYTTQITPRQYYLTQRGMNQTVRNNSCNIWSVFDWDETGHSDLIFRSMKSGYTTAADLSQLQKRQMYQKQNSNKIIRLQDEKLKNQYIQKSSQLQKNSYRKNVGFDLKQNQQISSLNKTQPQKSRQLNENRSINQKSLQKSKKVNINSYVSKKLDSNSPERKLQIPKKELTQQQKIRRQIFLRECYSIDKYIKSNKANTRLLPNSAIKLFYQRPCLQAYGRGNKSKKDGFIYNDFMKTHNVNPHRFGNQPKKYQTYRSALNFLKRTKFDPEQRWKQIHRQMRSRLDMKELVQYFGQGAIDVTPQTLQSTLKLNINTLKGTVFKRSKSSGNLIFIPDPISIDTKGRESKFDFNSTKDTKDFKDSKDQDPEYIKSLKRSKSWGKKQYLFLYKYTNKDGQTHYCKDRHGITCYVDPTFQQNKQAFINFQKKVHPIQGEDVSPSDRNLDQMLLQNFAISKQQDIPKHYLLPNCSQPYRAQKFSYKARKKNMNKNQQALN